MVRVAVLGAGPVGVEAALACAQEGWDVVLHEQARAVAGWVREWGHVRLFTPWPLDVSPRQAAAVGVPGAPDACPTGDELADHLERVAALLPDVRLGSRVVAVAREGLLKQEAIGTTTRARRPFRLLVEDEAGERYETADVVLDCTGSWGHPNPTGAGGVPALGERALGDRVLRAIPVVDEGWRGRRVLLVGAGNSAQTAARDLAAGGADVTWAVRAKAPGWGAVADDPLPAREALVASSRRAAAGEVPGVRLRTGVEVSALQPHGEGVRALLTSGEQVDVDVVVSCTGGVGDSGLFRALQVHQCYATEGPMALAATLLAGAGGDCLTQASAGVDALRNPEPRFFVLGSKSYGRTSTFLLRVGWEQVDEVVAALREELLVAA